MLNLKNIAKSVNLPKVNMNTAFNPSKLNSLYSRAMPSSYYDDAFNYASKVGFNVESPEFQKYLVDNINFKPQQWNSEINDYERVFKSPENVIDGLANRFNLNKSTIPLYRVDRNESMLSTDSFDALRRIKENTNLPHSKYMTLGTGDLDWYAKHPSWNIGKHSLSDSPNSQVMKLDLPKKDFSEYVAGSFMDPILETVQMSKPPGVGQKNKEFIIPTEMLARKGEDLGTYQDFLKLVEGDNALPLLDRMYTNKNHLGRWNSDDLTKSRYDRNNLENQIWAAHNLHLDQNLHEKFLTWPQNEKRFGEQYRSGQWGYKDGGSLPKYQPGGGRVAKQAIKKFLNLPKFKNADFMQHGKALRTSGKHTSVDDIINANQKFNAQVPMMYLHGTGSSSLPGIVNAGGLTSRNFSLPMTGELTGLGDNINHINNNFLSVAPITNPELALNYSLGASGPRNYLNEYNTFVDDLASGKFKDQDRNILLGEGYADKIKDINYNRLNTWNSADPANRLLLEENYPMLFGLNPKNTEMGADRYFHQMPNQLGPEAGIRGPVKFDEISNIYVPNSRIQQTTDFMGDNIGNIKINSMENFGETLYEPSGSEGVRFLKERKRAHFNDMLKRYKKDGGDLPEYQPGGGNSAKQAIKQFIKSPSRFFKSQSIGKGLTDAPLTLPLNYNTPPASNIINHTNSLPANGFGNINQEALVNWDAAVLNNNFSKQADNFKLDIPLTRVLDSKGISIRDGKLFSKTGDHYFRFPNRRKYRDEDHISSRNTTHWSYGHVGDPGHGSWSKKSTAIISDFKTLKESGYAMDLDPTDTYFYSKDDFRIPDNSLILTRDKSLYDKIRLQTDLVNVKWVDPTQVNDEQFKALVDSYGKHGKPEEFDKRKLFNEYVYNNWKQGIDVAQNKPASSYVTKRHQGYDYSPEFREKYPDMNILKGRPGWDPNIMDEYDRFDGGNSVAHSNEGVAQIEDIWGMDYRKHHGLVSEIGTSEYDFGQKTGHLDFLLMMPKPAQIFEMDKLLRLYKHKPEALRVQNEVAYHNGFETYKEFKASVSKAEMDNFKKDGGEQLPKYQFGGLSKLVKPVLSPLKKMLENNALYTAGRSGSSYLYDNLFNKGLEKSAMPHLLRGEQFVDNWYADPEVANYTESLYRKQYTDPSPFTQFNNWGEYSNFIRSNEGRISPDILRPFLENQPGYLSITKGALNGNEGLFSLMGRMGEQANNPGKSYMNPRIANSEMWLNSSMNPDRFSGVRMNDGWEGDYPINITRNGFQRDPQGLFDLAAHEKSHWYVRGAALVPKVTNRWEKFVSDDAFKVIKEASKAGGHPEGYDDLGDVYYQTPVEVQARVTETRGLLSDMGFNNAEILSLQTFGLSSIDDEVAEKVMNEITASRAGQALFDSVVKDGKSYIKEGEGYQKKAFDNLFNLMRYTPVVAAPIVGAEMLQEEEGLSEQKIGGEIKKHTIVRGDTGKTLFEKYGVNSSDIKEHNDIKFFKEGQEIEIPSKELSKAQDGRETPSFRNLHDESGNLKLSGEELEAWRSPRGYTYKQLADYNNNIAKYTPQDGIDLQDKTTWEGKHYGSPFNSSNYDLEGFANSDWNPQSYDDAYGMNRDIENASFFYRGQPYSTESKEDNILNWKDEKTLEGIINDINNTSISGMIEDENLQSPEDYYGYLVNQYKDDTDKSRLLKDIKTDFPDDYLSFFSGSSDADRINTLRSDQTTGKPISDYRSSYSTAQGAEGTDEGGYTTAIDNTAYTIPAMEMNPEAAAAQAQNNELREAKLNSYLTNDEYFNQGEGSYTEFSNEYDLEQTNEFKKGYASQYIPEDQIEAFINYTPGSSDEQNPLFDEVYKGYNNQKFVHNVGNINAGKGETSTGTFGLGAYDYNLDEFAEGEIPYYLKDRRASLLSNTDRLEPENYNRYENRDKTFWEDSVGDWWNTVGGKSQNAGLAPSLLHGIADWGGQMIGGAANSISGGNIPSWEWKTGERFRENPNFNTGANAGLDIASVTPLGRLAKMAQSAKFLGTGMKLNKGLKGNLNLLRGNAKDLGVYERMMRFDKANPGVLNSNVGPKGFNIPSNVPGRNYNLNQGMFRNPYANQIGNSGANWNMLTPKGYVNPNYLVPSYLGAGALDMNTNPNVTITNK